MATFHFDLVSPEKLAFSGEVDQVDIPGVEGDFGVLAGHAPVISAIRPGILTVFSGGKQEKIIVLDAPGPRFRIETTILPTFVPMQLSPQTETDARELGAKVTYEFLPPRKAAHK